MDISLIVLMHGAPPDVVERCFSCIAKSVGISWQLIVVDRMGDAQTLTRVSQISPRATVILQKDDKGIVHAIHQGLHHATGDFVVVLDVCVSFSEDVLLRVLTHMHSRAQVMVSGVSLHMKDSAFYLRARAFPSFKDCVRSLLTNRNFFQKHSFFSREENVVQQDIIPLILPPYFLCFRRSIFTSVGFLNLQYTTWIGIAEYIQRICVAYGKVEEFSDIHALFLPLRVTHSQAFYERVYMFRDMRLFFRTQGRRFAWLVLVFLTPLFYLKFSLLALVRDKKSVL